MTVEQAKRFYQVQLPNPAHKQKQQEKHHKKQQQIYTHTQTTSQLPDKQTDRQTNTTQTKLIDNDNSQRKTCRHRDRRNGCF